MALWVARTANSMAGMAKATGMMGWVKKALVSGSGVASSVRLEAAEVTAASCRGREKK
jgi:hypothetical protein